MMHARSNSNAMSLLELLALPSPATSPPSVGASASSRSSPWPIRESLFTKRINVNLALLRIPAATIFALGWSGQTVEKVVLHVNRLDSNHGRGSSRSSDFGKF